MCYHPWVGLDISPQGEFKPCCKIADSFAYNLVDYMASPELAQLKQDFAQGILPSICKRCWDDEDSGLPSKRQLDWKYVFEETVPNLDDIKVLSFPFGNSCNLACRTCLGYYSSTWITEDKKQGIQLYKHHKFYKDKEFLNQIKQISADVKHVEFPGGEPFIAGVDEHLDFLNFLIENNDPSGISLHYITNATIFPKEEFWDRWAKFKNVDIQLSIDGTGNRYEYIRWPAKWADVEENIKRYQEKTSIQLSISHTVSVFNVYYLPEFTKWCLQNRLGKPYIGLASYPNVYNIKVLPSHIKDKLAEKLSSFSLENVVQYMNSEDLSQEFPDTIDLINKLDQQRGQDFSATFPEFTKFLEDSYA